MIDDKTFIIDPLTTLCKVALLHFFPEKTKLAISHHVLCIQDYSCYQWIERMKNGDSRIDISHLNTPLIKAIHWYIIDSPSRVQLDNATLNSIKTIASYAIMGLIKLQNCTYQTDLTIKIILQYFINMLRDALNNYWNEDECVKMENQNNNILTDKIKNSFECHIINSIATMLLDANQPDKSADDINVLIDCAHKLLINRDNLFVKMMKEINTNL